MHPSTLPISSGPAWLRPSVLALVAANLLPLGGVLFLGWVVFPLVFLFWLENVIVGGFNVLKMLAADAGSAAAWAAKVFMIPFFCVHYGLFCFVHGVFVVALFGRGVVSPEGFPSPGTFWQVLQTQHLGWAALGLGVSHGLSYVLNFLRGGEYRQAKLDGLMMAPYARVVVLHLAILAGGFLILSLGSPLWALILLLALKVAVDLRAHLRERQRFAPAPAGDAGKARGLTGPGADA